MDDSRFEGMRPYNEAEIPAAMRRIADSEYFPQLACYVFPGMPADETRELVGGLTTTDDFQKRVMSQMVEQVIRRSISEFTFGGLNHISPDESYLFVANHRDITLDSSLMQHVLFTHGYPTTEITFGANLMTMPLVVDIGKANKMFRVERAGEGRDFYGSSGLLSDYIRHAITAIRHSVWIAQRNGRTKDGIDRTDQGLINMLGKSGGGSSPESLAELHIAPVAISYEWEPCDMRKAAELYARRGGRRYLKSRREDIESILHGILEPKGRAHLEFCRPIAPEELQELDNPRHGEFNKAVAKLIDARILAGYRLMPSNYAASDMLRHAPAYAGLYTDDERLSLERRADTLTRLYPGYDPAALTALFLGIYANPVDNRPDEEPQKTIRHD